MVKTRFPASVAKRKAIIAILAMMMILDLYKVFSPNPELEKYFPARMRFFMHAAEGRFCSEIQDRYAVTRYAVYPSIIERLTEHVSADEKWYMLPISENEFETYIKECCGWASGEYDYFSAYALKDPGCRGYWRYSGDYDGEQSGYFGHHEMVMMIMDDWGAEVIYMDVVN